MKTAAPIYQTSPSELDAMKQFFLTWEPRLARRRRIPVAEPNISSREIRYVTRAISSSWISSTGDYVKRFEKLFAQIVSKTKFAISVNSGTSALHVALAALGVGPGDEVILPTFTMIATINAVAYCGAIPVLIDADPVTWNMNASGIEKHVTSRTKAIIAVHTYGLPADMDTIMRVARKHDLWVVEDAAEAHGATYRGKSVGGIGDVGAFSLYANKIITTGEGGMVVTNNQEIATRITLLHNNAFTQDMHFWHTMIGFGYRMTNLQAAVGVAQVERFTKLLAIKRANADLYIQLLAGIPGITLPYEAPSTRHSYWMFGILVDKSKFGMDKYQLRTYLSARGIETRSFFIPIHAQPPYRHLFKNIRYPVSEQLCHDGLYLPSSTKLTRRNITYIVGMIRKAFESH